MNEERAFCSRLLVPRNKLGLVCVTGKAADGVDARSHRNFFAQNLDLFGPVDDAACKRARGGVADEHHARFRSPEVVLEMMPYATARRHSRSRHNDRAATNFVERDGLGLLARVMQSGQVERIVPRSYQGGDLRLQVLQ